MNIQSIGASLPNLNPLGVGSLGSGSTSPSTLSTPPAGGTGYSKADTFEAAPQRAVSGAGYGTDAASTGYSSPGAASGPAGTTGPALDVGGTIDQQFDAIIQSVGELALLVQDATADITGAAGPGGAPGPGGAINLGNVTGDPRLQQAMQEIARDPEGGKLVQGAQAQGLKLQVGNLPPGVMGQHLDGVITISPRALSNKPDLIHTLAHELGHAATRNDGDSINEEQTVDQLGQRIQQRIAPGPTFQLDIGSYRGLPQDNGVRNSLARFGL